MTDEQIRTLAFIIALTVALRVGWDIAWRLMAQ